MKRIYLYLLLIIVIGSIASCKKDNQIDVRTFGKTVIDSLSAGKGPSNLYVYAYSRNFPYQKSEIKVTLNNQLIEVLEINRNNVLLHIPQGATSGDLKFVFNRVNPQPDYVDYSDIVGTSASHAIIIDESTIPPPIVTGFGPKSGDPGDEVVITGYNFATGIGQLKMLFGTAEAEVVAVTNTRITLKVPAIPALQTYPVIVTQGSYRVTAGLFNILEQPPIPKAAYWIDSSDGTIKKATFSATGTPLITTVLAGAAPRVFALNQADNSIYYSTSRSGVRKIYDDGTGLVTPIYAAARNSVSSIAVSEGSLFCGEKIGPTAGSHYITKISAAGGGTPVILYEIPNAPEISCLRASSLTLGKIYWTEQLGIRIMEGSRNGETDKPAKVLFDASDGLVQPTAVAIDETAGKVYIFDGFAEKAAIYSGNLDGSGTLTKLPIDPTQLLGVYSLKVDPAKGVLYWLNFGDKERLMSCRINGSNVRAVVPDISFSVHFDIIF